MSLPSVKKVDTLGQMMKILDQANDKIEQFTRARDKWHNMYWLAQKELAILQMQTSVLCGECTTARDETPEGKTLEVCFRCIPDSDKTRLLERAETEARYWQESYDHLFQKYQEELYRHDARGAYDTCR